MSLNFSLFLDKLWFATFTFITHIYFNFNSNPKYLVDISCSYVEGFIVKWQFVIYVIDTYNILRYLKCVVRCLMENKIKNIYLYMLIKSIFCFIWFQFIINLHTKILQQQNDKSKVLVHTFSLWREKPFHDIYLLFMKVFYCNL